MGYITTFPDAQLSVAQGIYKVTFDAATLTADRTYVLQDADIGASGSAQAAVQTAATVTASTLGDAVVIPLDTTSNAITVNLPAISSTVRRYVITHVNGSAVTNNITIHPASGDAVGDKAVDTDDTIIQNFNTITMESIVVSAGTDRWIYQ